MVSMVKPSLGWLEGPLLGFTFLLELPNPIVWSGGRASKIKAWHQVIETILYTSGTKPNLVTLSAEKKNHPVLLLGVAGK